MVLLVNDNSLIYFICHFQGLNSSSGMDAAQDVHDMRSFPSRLSMEHIKPPKISLNRKKVSIADFLFNLVNRGLRDKPVVPTPLVVPGN